MRVDEIELKENVFFIQNVQWGPPNVGVAEIKKSLRKFSSYEGLKFGFDSYQNDMSIICGPKCSVDASGQRTEIKFEISP